MEVILLQNVDRLGRIGDVVKVKDGFARNILLPNKKALRANEANRKVFEANRERLEAENASRRADAEREVKGLEGVSVTLIRQASNTGQLYGSVAVRDLVEALVADGHKVAKSQIVLDRPIKAIGLYEVRVALHPEVSVTVKVNVARSPEEADMQAQGVDVMASMFEKEETGFFEQYDPVAEPGAGDDAAYRLALHADFVELLPELPEQGLDELSAVLAKARERVSEPDVVMVGKGLGSLVSLAEGRVAIGRIAVDAPADDWAQSELLGAAQMARELSISPATLANWRSSGRLLAFKRGPRNYVYPKRQVYRGSLIAGLAEVARHFDTPEDAWEWLVTPNVHTLGLSPIDRLRVGARDEVERAAEGAVDFA